MNSKTLFASKTFWFNLVTTAVALLGAISQQGWIQAHPERVAMIGAVVGFLNIVLRLFTSQPIDGVKPSAAAKLLVFVATIAMMAMAPRRSYAQATPALSVAYDISAHRVLSGVTYRPFATLHDLAGVKGLNADVLAFGGLDQFGAGAIGGEVAFPVRVSRELDATIGFGGVLIAGAKAHGIVTVGVGWRL